MENSSSLFRGVSELTDWWDMAVIGGPSEDDNHLAAGYRFLAGAGVKQWQEASYRTQAHDWAVVPILNAYRHSIELALKAGIRDAAACVRADGIGGPDTARDAVEERLAKTHSLKTLTGELKRWTDMPNLGGYGESSELVNQVLHALHGIDESGQVFRYSLVKQGRGKNRVLVPARPDEQAMDFVATAEALGEVAGLLIDGLSTMLYEYAEFRRELRDYS
jgi:hypothetical protein